MISDNPAISVSLVISNVPKILEQVTINNKLRLKKTRPKNQPDKNPNNGFPIAWKAPRIKPTTRVLGRVLTMVESIYMGSSQIKATTTSVQSTKRNNPRITSAINDPMSRSGSKTIWTGSKNQPKMECLPQL